MPSKRNYLRHNRIVRPAPRTYEPRPFRRWKSSAPLPKILDLANFIEVHRHVDDKIKDYLDYPRPDWLRVDYAIWLELMRSAAWLMHANNAESRIRFAEIAVRHVQAHREVQSGPVFFVTLTPAACTVPLAEAPAFDVRHLQTMAREALRGVPFLGMVEGALYINWGPDGPCRGFFVSWHVHLLAWNTSRLKLEIALEDFRASHVSLLPHSSPAFIQGVFPEQIIAKLVYMLKAPQKEHWVNGERGEFIDPETGEVLSDRRRQQKRPLRTGNRVRMLGAIGSRTLDQLLFGNSEGIPLSRAIKAEALRTFRVWERKQPWHHSRAKG